MKVVTSRRFNIKMEDDINAHTLISGIEFMPDGKLLLCDYRNYRLKLLGSDLSMIDTLNLTLHPWDISAVNSSSVLITLPRNLKNQLQFVHVMEGLQLSSIIQMEKNCWGVIVIETEIFTSCHDYEEGEIIVLDLTGTVKRRIGVSDQQEKSYMFKTPYYVTVSVYTGNIYVADWNNHSVTGLSSTGDVIYQFTDPGMERPCGLYVDEADNIIVCGKTSHTCEIITANGKYNKTMLTSVDGLKFPYAVQYRKNDTSLVVGGWNNDNLLLFTLTS